VTIEIALGSTSLYAYLNSLVIKAYSLDAPAVTQAAAAAGSGVEEAVVLSGAQAFPNPVQSDVTLRVPLARAVPVLTVRLSDASGAILSTQRFNNLAQGTWQQRIALQGRASRPGVYFIHLSGLPDGKTQVLKIVKGK
jgi:hypothetical protein